MRINDQQQFELEQTINAKINDSHALVRNFRNVIVYESQIYPRIRPIREFSYNLPPQRERRQPPPLLLSVNHS